MADNKIYVPKQTVRRGKAGYRGDNVVVVDRESGKETVAPKGKGKKK